MIQVQRLTYPAYLDRLRSYPLHDYLPRANADPYPRGVAEAISLSIEAVTAADPSGFGRDLLVLLSVLSPEGVSRQFLHAGAVAGALGGGPAEVDTALGRLADASLVSFSPGESAEPMVTVHRLVARVARDRALGDGSLPALGYRVFGMLTAADEPLGEPWWDRPALRELGLHVDAMAGHLDDIYAQTLPLSIIISWLRWRNIRLETEGAYLHSVAVQLVRVATAAGVAVSQELLDMDRWDDERLRSKLRAIEEEHSERRTEFGGQHPVTQLARDSLAYTYLHLGQPGKAASLYERTLADRVRKLGPRHLLTLRSQNSTRRI